MKKGLLLINLGTPDACTLKAIRRYLKEFLNDPRVIDLPFAIRWLLVNMIIIPFRAKNTLHAYQAIWTDAGSPLAVFSKELHEKLNERLGSNYQIAFGMRYGNPSIESALKQLSKCEHITVLPLFPQYSSAATGSAIERVLDFYKSQYNIPRMTVINDFYANPNFIHAYTSHIQHAFKQFTPELVLFSFHGLPERHIDKSECNAHCDRINSCPLISIKNHYCYRAQCFSTARQIAEQLNLNQDQFKVVFQSRLGKTPWIKPYIDLELPKLIHAGIKSIAVVSPSFVSDCLETLEEINIRLREQWQQLGGKEFIFVSALNTQPIWLDALTNIISHPL